jgi:hypothetical protein
VHVEIVDLETNVPYGHDVPVMKTVERRQTKPGDHVLGQRTNSAGDALYIIAATDDDIMNKQGALVSKAIRTLALRLVPGDLIDEAMDQVMITQKTEDAADPDLARRKLFDAFGSLGITIEQLKLYLGSDGSSLSPKETSDLRALYAALRDGETTWREVVDGRDPGAEATGVLSAADLLAQRRKERQAAAAKTTEKAAPKADDRRPVESYIEALNNATSQETGALVLDEARGVLTDDEYGVLCDAFKTKWGAP